MRARIRCQKQRNSTNAAYPKATSRQGQDCVEGLGFRAKFRVERVERVETVERVERFKGAFRIADFRFQWPSHLAVYLLGFVA